MSHEMNIDARIQAFNARKANKTFSHSVADWFGAKFGDRDASVQSGETIVGMKYEPASRGKL